MGLTGRPAHAIVPHAGKSGCLCREGCAAATAAPVARERREQWRGTVVGALTVERDDNSLGWGTTALASAPEGDSENTLNLYMQDISRVPLLTAAEEQELARAMEQGARARAALGETTDPVQVALLHGVARAGRRAPDRL